MTSSEIIQRLLDEKHITVEEAMVLIQNCCTQQQPYCPNFWWQQSPVTSTKYIESDIPTDIYLMDISW